MGLLGRKTGDLRVYLGAAPGVGKTYSMLAEAHRRAERGTDVVAAIVETHGRRKVSQQLIGIEVVPPLVIEHDGRTYHEIDVDAVLQRRPKVVLVDDFAHTNAPGSRNKKRWQDVEELLNAGITVITTVNITNLESVADLARQITGVDEPDRIPDEVVRAADQIELVDITPEALRRRLAHGNVYPPERVDAALSNYFRAENLTALRQLTLMWLADQVDAALAKYRSDKKISDKWQPRERVVVGVTGGPESEALVRRASWIASRSGADLRVVFVVDGSGLTAIPDQQKKSLRELAASLGATMHTVIGEDVAGTLISYAEDVNATQLVVGTSRRTRLARLFDVGISESVVRQAGGLDVHVVPHDQAAKGLSWSRLSPRQRKVTAWLAAAAIPAVVCALAALLPEQALRIGGPGALSLIGVLAVALIGGLGPALLSAVLSGLLLTYFLLPPTNTFAIGDGDTATATLVPLVVSVVAAALVDRSARRAAEARRANQEAALLAMFADGVLQEADPDELLERLREAYSQRSVSLVRSRTGEVVAQVGRDPCTDADDADTVVEIDGDEFLLLLAGPTLTARDRRVLSGVGKQAVNLVRQQQRAEALNAHVAGKAEELRQALLTAVGHDLRSPLAAARSAMARIRNGDTAIGAEKTSELLDTVEESVDQLTMLVANLLDSARLVTGAVRPDIGRVEIEPLVQRALLGIRSGTDEFTRPGSERVKLAIDCDAVLADAQLLERVLANLIDNSLRYAAGSPVRVTAGQVGERVLIAVVDEGPGLPRGSEQQAFAPFQRLTDDDSIGVGLGLTVASGFVEAMGGTISVSDTPGGGLTVEIELPAAPKQ
ncbi:universal stress family protein [Mycolicibacterium hassiacum DSM 44199]|jgi:two-component system sensor histidine kinase KdpD|uniref:histidine kinase n=1 Tax=Mycolicibacterium hassiacum (strain DSM 44199 / CIP 105218 / JCM 12690 / 3849) TaxID=1122247 RepID=K5BJ82_MYCHD|nr:ATP-binding protein [Mycolicibacterium hassiacum]EKF22659.1 universal stress family protein [Mycolicibacterium hassiacum DSM 44199]MBX5487742.1 sensor histidine kinase KdpD [Mycolicibacterium hassiacum]MDA4088833.1 histidine kinase [Mycolicibacterium hassiacum DSM 44199]VCT91563.1 Sensor protein KdpD [Mycolicibacterium hassiacum DSM 44199]